MLPTSHPLAEWIDARMTRDAFARLVETSKSHLSLILQGKRGVSFALAQRIERETEGAITAARLMEDQKALMEAAE